MDPLYWDERDSTINDQPLHITARNKVIMISPLIHFWLASFVEFALGHLAVTVTQALRYPETGNFPHAQANLRHGARWR